MFFQIPLCVPSSSGRMLLSSEYRVGTSHVRVLGPASGEGQTSLSAHAISQILQREIISMSRCQLLQQRVPNPVTS